MLYSTDRIGERCDKDDYFILSKFKYFIIKQTLNYSFGEVTNFRVASIVTDQ